MILCIYFISVIAYISAFSYETQFIHTLPVYDKNFVLNKVARRILENGKLHKTEIDSKEKGLEITDKELNEHAAYVNKLLMEETNNRRSEGLPPYNTKGITRFRTIKRVKRANPDEDIKSSEFVRIGSLRKTDVNINFNNSLESYKLNKNDSDAKAVSSSQKVEDTKPNQPNTADAKQSSNLTFVKLDKDSANLTFSAFEDFTRDDNANSDLRVPAKTPPGSSISPTRTTEANDGNVVTRKRFNRANTRAVPKGDLETTTDSYIPASTFVVTTEPINTENTSKSDAFFRTNSSNENTLNGYETTLDNQQKDDLPVLTTINPAPFTSDFIVTLPEDKDKDTASKTESSPVQGDSTIEYSINVSANNDVKVPNSDQTELKQTIFDANKAINESGALLSKFAKFLKSNFGSGNGKALLGARKFTTSEISASLSLPKEYNVYEVAPNQTPFELQTQAKVQISQKSSDASTLLRTSVDGEQPNYVPVYNYDPAYAYFNAYNRLGPNPDDNDVDNNDNKHVDETSKDDGNVLRNHKSDRLDTNYVFSDEDDNINMFRARKENNENLKTRLKNAREKLVRMKNAEKLKKSDQDYNLDREQPDIASDYIFGRSYSAEKQPYEEDGYRIIKFGDTVSNYRTSDKKVKQPNKLNIDYDDTNMDELVQFFGKLIERNTLPPKKKQRDDGTLAIYLEAMDQVIRNNDKSLAQYDWLSTTVDVQAALKKLSLITYAVQQAKELNPGDIQLLKYILNLYEASKSLDTLPRNKNPDSNNPYTYGSLQNDLNVAVVKMKVNSYRAYANLARRSNNKLDLNGFVIFLDDLRSGLNELHNTIKHIAIITKFRQQHWYEDLKLLYLKDPSKKQLIEVLLHLFTTRLVGLIEDGAQNGVLENYKVFMRNNKDVVQKSVLELDFVLKLLKEFKKL